MKSVIADERLSQECRRALEMRGFDVVLMPPCTRLAPPVASHPDMLFFMIGGKLVCHRDYYDAAWHEIDKIILRAHGRLELCVTDGEYSEKYPNDILFNALCVGKYLYGLEKYISSEIKKLAAQNGITVVNIRQGYAKCSACVISDNAVITSDPSVACALISRGCDVLRVCTGSIRLDGYDSGFIGGASGSDGRYVYFTGDIASHPDGEAIKDFCEKHGKSAISLSHEKLYDVGTLIFP